MSWLDKNYHEVGITTNQSIEHPIDVRKVGTTRTRSNGLSGVGAWERLVGSNVESLNDRITIALERSRVQTDHIRDLFSDLYH